jgi:potassium channel subfamily K, other eukaryote
MSFVLKAITAPHEILKDRPVRKFIEENPETVKVAIKNLIIVIVFYAVASVYYNQVEGWDLEDCIYFITVTISTVGYGDYEPSSDDSRLFTIFVILFGLIFVFSIINDFAMYIIATATKRAQEIVKNKSEDDLKNEDPYKYFKKYAYAIGTILALLFVGSIFFWQNEDWSFIEAMYWVVCTMTTVGYGDLTLEHQSSRLFLIFFIPLSVCAVAGALGTLGSIEFERSAEAKRKANLSRQLDFNMIREMDTDGDGVDKCEFLVAMLVQNEICDLKNDIQPWLTRFDELDADGSGKLDEEDIRIMEAEEKARILRLKEKGKEIHTSNGYSEMDDNKNPLVKHLI